MSGDEASLLPHPKDGDPEDVVWALETAASLWKRGERDDAISWVRRAANAAADAEADLRVIELAKAAAELKAYCDRLADPKSEGALEIELEAPAETVALASEGVEPEPARHAAPPRPPPRRLPTPNPVPSPLTRVPFEQIAAAAQIDEVDAPPAADLLFGTDPTDSADSGHVPTLAPSPPDFSPTPMAMQVAKSVPPPWEPPPPRVAIAPEQPGRLNTAPLGSMPFAATELPPPSDPEVVTSAPPIARLRTPPLGSPAPSLRPSSAPLPERASNRAPGGSSPPPSVPGAPRVPSWSPPASGPIALDPQLFDSLGELSPRVRDMLEASAEKVLLGPGELADAPAMVIVVHGELEVRAPGYESCLDTVGEGEVRLLSPIGPADGQLDLRGGPEGARFLSFDLHVVEQLVDAVPEVVKELEPASDDLHVVAGCLRGRHGLALDGPVLEALLARAKTMRLGPHAKVVKQGETVRALILVGAGALDVRAGDDLASPVLETLDPGDVVFARELLGRGPAPAFVRAGAEGALVLVVTRAATEEIFAALPFLTEILGDA